MSIRARETPMTRLEIKGDWNIIKGNLKQMWATLTEDDLQFQEGKAEELLGRIQRRTGATADAIRAVLRAEHTDKSI